MLLVLDIGNTTTVAGIFDEKNLIAHWRISTTSRTGDELGLMLINLLMATGINSNEIKGAAFSSVVPSVDFFVHEAIKKYFHVEALQVTSKENLDMKILVKNPAEVGADRIVNAFAGREKYGSPLIVADYGTAITFDVVSPEGDYLGGAIAPGLQSGISALFSKAAKLPQVALSIPEDVIGKSTEEAIQSGVLYGNAGLTDRIIEMIKKKPGFENSKVIATGGHAGLMKKISKNIDIVDNWLMLEGLKLILTMKQK